MKIRKSFKQKNVALDNCMYTERELCQLLADRKIWCFGNDYGVSYEYMGESTEYRVFTEIVDKLEVEYSKEWEFFVTVAILKDGSKLYVKI